MKKLFIILISINVLVGCIFQKEPITPFDTFINQTTNYFLEGTTSFNLNFIFNHTPYDGKAFGLGFVSEEEYLENMDGYQDILNSLKKYPFQSLSTTQQIIYVALEDYLKRQLVMRDYYYYDNDYIGSYSTIIQELPLLLELYTFNDINDIEYYFKNIEAFTTDFKSAIAFEKERQEMGLGLSKKILDDTKLQIQSIIDENGKNIITNVNQNIDHLDFLSDQQKDEYKEKNKHMIETTFINAYQTLLDGLNEIEGLTNHVSIHDKNYYEAIIYHQLGIQTKISSIKNDLYDTYNESYDTLYTLISMNQEVTQSDNIYDIQYNEFNDVKSGLDYLKGKIFSIVPLIKDLSYEIYIIPESLSDGFAPAAYLSPKVDMTTYQKECIMINPSSPSDNIFPTLVHEGYPGHMYQNTYLRLKNYPDMMYLIDCIGYSEGWSIYMENRASEFLEENISWQKLLQANDNLTSSLLAIIDINIHYEGWDYDECLSFFNEYTGANYTTELEDLYDIILQTPGYYLYYIYAGEILHDLYEKAKDDVGKNFDEIKFHQVILDSGPVGLDIVKKNVKTYINANK